MKQPTVPEGLQPRYTHLRWAEGDRNITSTTHHLKLMELKPSPKGGYTRCALVDSNGNTVGAGIAKCSQKDQFSRSVGRIISLGRAISSLQHKHQPK